MSPSPSIARRSNPSSSARSARSAQIHQLFRAWRAGDQRAGETLFRELRALLGACFRGHPPHVVDDLIQETLVACVLARGSIRCEDAFMGYVYTIVRRLPIHRLHRQSQPTVEFDETTVVEDPDAAGIDHRIEAQRLLRACPSPCTRLVALRYLEGRHGVEIAQALHISEASVRRRIRRGLAELRASAKLPASP